MLLELFFWRDLPNIVNIVLVRLGLDSTDAQASTIETMIAFQTFEQQFCDERPSLHVGCAWNLSSFLTDNVTSAEQVAVEAGLTATVLDAAAIDVGQAFSNFSVPLGGDPTISTFEGFLVWDDEMLNQCWENPNSNMLYDSWFA